MKRTRTHLREVPDDVLTEVKRRFGIVGHSPPLNEALRKAIIVAPTDLTVLLQGESGVGKEVFAKVIHALSLRRHKPFIAVNCAAIPEGTMDSELFGHEKGAFTGAYETRIGYFEAANGGTIFLDEVSEMPWETQAKLLRVLETGEFMRVGSSQVRKTDVRVIAATNRDLQELVRLGKFRQDLYYRISTVPIRIPPLRERGTDILLLFQKFAIDYAEYYGCEPIELTPEAQALLLKYPWPGNVRQLKHTVEQLTILSPERQITPETLRKVLPDLDFRPVPAQVMGNVGSSIPTPASPSTHTATHQASSSPFSSLPPEMFWLMLQEIRNELRTLRLLIEQQRSMSSPPPSTSPSPGTAPESISTDSAPADMRATTPPYSDQYTTTSPISSTLIPPTTVSHSQNTQPEHHQRKHPAETSSSSPLEDEDYLPTFREMEHYLIRKALKKYGGRRKDAARALGISERTLYRKMKAYNIEG